MFFGASTEYASVPGPPASRQSSTNGTPGSVSHSPTTLPFPSTRAMRTEFTFSSAFEGNPSNVHHTAVKSPLKSNVRCSTACSDPSVSACAVMSTFVMS